MVNGFRIYNYVNKATKCIIITSIKIRKYSHVMRVNVKNQSWGTLPMFAKSILLPIAQACPYEAGPAVHKARAILYYYTGQRYQNSCENMQLSSSLPQQRLKKVKDAEEGVDEILVFPNPTKDNLTVELELKKDESVYFKLYDLSGKLLLNALLNKEKNTLNLKGLTKGMYLYRIHDNEGGLLKNDKLIIQ